MPGVGAEVRTRVGPEPVSVASVTEENGAILK
jgi:hypothetical protein